MPPDRTRLAEAGQALYGDRWQSDIARDLEVDPRRVRQWMAGERPIPSGIWPELVQLLRRRGDRARSLADQLENDAV